MKKVTCAKYEDLRSSTNDFHSLVRQGRMEPSTSVIEDLNIPVGPIRESQPSKLNYNEYIVFNKKQVKMKYLVKVKVDYSRWSIFVWKILNWSSYRFHIHERFFIFMFSKSEIMKDLLSSESQVCWKGIYYWNSLILLTCDNSFWIFVCKSYNSFCGWKKLIYTTYWYTWFIRNRAQVISHQTALAIF